MLRIDLNSTSLAAAAYSEEQQLLELRFRNGEIYHYFSVPPEIYGDLLRAPSKGAYFNQGIRDRFAYVKSSGGHRLQSSVVPNQPPQPLVALAPHGAECQSPLPSESLTFCGRTFSAGEVDLMRHLAAEFSALAVTEIAHTVCELLHWRRPGGGLKSHECRQLLERLAAGGLLQLPALRKTGGNGARRPDISMTCSEPRLVECSASECGPLELVRVEGKKESRLWRAQVERHHYLGCSVPFGAHLRYWVRNRQRELACLLWTSPAWKMQARDAWIGWSDRQRQRNLQSIVNNSRFLILPWVRVKGLASKILGLSARQMPADWESRYGTRPLLLETLVDAARFRGTCYRAANWIYLGQTTGRGRMDREHDRHGQSVKAIYVYPLSRNSPQQLRSELKS